MPKTAPSPCGLSPNTTISSLFIFGGTLLVMGDYTSYTDKTVKYDYVTYVNGQKQYVTSTYTYKVQQFSTTLKYYDLSQIAAAGSEPSELSLVRETTFNGTYQTARLVNGYFYVVISDRSSGETAYFDTQDKDKKVDFTEGEEGSGGDNRFGGYGMIAAKIEAENAFTAPYTTGRYLGDAYDVYCSYNALYIMSRGYANYNGGGRGYYGCAGQIKAGYAASAPGGYAMSIVRRISLETLQLESVLADVEGNILNRFALHDDGEHIFTVSRTNRGTFLNVYNAEFETLAVAGPYAPGENLYSVRYDEDADTGRKYCYFVTFQQVDPLFKIDITDPLKPELTGDLKIPGYSTYMQNFGNGVLLGVGFDVDTRWGAQPTGLKVSLFDVSGPYPEEVNSIIIQNGKSEATDNARAILCEKGKNMFAFAAEGRRGGKPAQGAYIYGIGANGRLFERAFLTNLPDGYTAQNQNHARKTISRVVWIGDYLYTIADGVISSYNLADFSYIDTYEVRIINKNATVTFLTEKDGAVYGTAVAEYGELLVMPNAPVREGYIFDGWVKVSNGLAFNPASRVYESFTVYAFWIAIK